MKEMDDENIKMKLRKKGWNKWWGNLIERNEDERRIWIKDGERMEGKMVESIINGKVERNGNMF